MANQQHLELGRKAIVMGFINANQLAQCMRIHQQNPKAILEIMLEEGFLTSQQAIQIQESSQNPTHQIPPTTTSHSAKTEDNITNQPFGRYQLLGEIGKGGMGRVYKAYDTSLDRIVALKVLLTGEMARPEDIQRFVREAKATAKLRHPNIIAVYDTGIENGQNFFTMDLIEGITLFQYLKQGIHSNRSIVDMITKVTEAIQYAHEQGIIHRDLKPANIMIDRENAPKVMDFGLAKIVRDSNKISQSGVVIGTLQYMPPEQANGKIRQIDARSDVYSLGAVLYEALVGQPPFIGNSFSHMLAQVINNDPTPPSNIKQLIPKDLESICLKALEKKKEQRYQSAKELAEDLSRFARGEPVMARPPGLRRIVWKKIKRHKIAAIISATVFIASLALIIGISTSRYIEQQRIKNNRLTIIQNTINSAEAFFKETLTATQIQNKYPRANIYAEIGVAEQEERTAILKKYQKIKLQVERAFIMAPKNPKLRDVLLQIEKEIGLLALGGRNYILSELSFERCQDLDSDESNQLLAILQKQKQQIKNAQIKHIQKTMQSVADTPKEGEMDQYVTEIIRMQGRHITQTLIPFVTSKNIWQRLLAIEVLGKLADIDTKIKQKNAGDWLLNRLKKVNPKRDKEEVQKLIWALARLKHAPADIVVYNIRSQFGPHSTFWENTKIPYTWIPISPIKPQNASEWAFRGARKLEKNDKPGAITDCTKAIELDPKNAEAYYNRGMAYFYSQSTGLNYIFLMTLTNQEFTSKPNENIMQNNVHLKKALENMLQAVKLSPSSTDMLSNLAFVYHLQNNNREAIIEITKAIVLEPKNILPYFARGLFYLKSGKYNKAINDYSKIIELDPTSAARAYTNRGMAHFSKGNITKAIKDYTAAIELSPSEALLYLNRSLAYSGLQMMDKAITDAKAAIKLNPRMALAYNNLGMAHYQTGNHKLAIENYDQALLLDPKLSIAYSNRGLSLLQLKKYDKALQDCARAVNLEPDLAIANNNLGMIYYEQKKYPQALKYFSLAIAKNSSCLQAYSNRAAIYYFQKKYKLAVADCNKVIKNNKNFFAAYNQRALAYQGQKKYHKALKDFTKAIELAPRTPQLYINRGLLYNRLKDYKKAIGNYNFAIFVNPKIASAYLFRGDAHYEQNPQLAIRDYTQVIQLDSNPSKAYRKRAELYKKQGKHRLAVADYRQFLKRNPKSSHAKKIRKYLANH